MAMARKQVLVQFTDRLLARLDQHVSVGGRSRSEVVRDAVEAYLDSLDPGEADRRLVEAYTRLPQDPASKRDHDRFRELIEEEPW